MEGGCKGPILYIPYIIYIRRRPYTPTHTLTYKCVCGGGCKGPILYIPYRIYIRTLKQPNTHIDICVCSGGGMHPTLSPSLRDVLDATLRVATQNILGGRMHFVTLELRSSVGQAKREKKRFTRHCSPFSSSAQVERAYHLCLFFGGSHSSF